MTKARELRRLYIAAYSHLPNIQNNYFSYKNRGPYWICHTVYHHVLLGWSISVLNDGVIHPCEGAIFSILFRENLFPQNYHCYFFVLSSSSCVLASCRYKHLMEILHSVPFMLQDGYDICSWPFTIQIWGCSIIIWIMVVAIINIFYLF